MQSKNTSHCESIDLIPSLLKDFDIDFRVHAFLKTIRHPDNLLLFLNEISDRNSKNYNLFAYEYHVTYLYEAHMSFMNHIELDRLHCYQLEDDYIYIATIFSDMAFVSPNIKNTNKVQDNKKSLETLQIRIKNIIIKNNILIRQLDLIDDSPKKLETRKLKGLLARINYFLEHKYFQVLHFSKKI